MHILRVSYTEIWLADFAPLDLPVALQDTLSRVNITLNIERISMGQIGEMVAQGGPGWDGFMFVYTLPGTTQDPARIRSRDKALAVTVRARRMLRVRTNNYLYQLHQRILREPLIGLPPLLSNLIVVLLLGRLLTPH